MNPSQGEQLYIQGKIDEAVKVLENEESGRSLYLLGSIYREGYGHVWADEKKAISYFQKGYDQGDALCGVALFGSREGKEMWDLVNTCFAKALEQAVAGDVLAMDEVGRFYNGEGVIYKPEEGMKWLTKAAFYEYWRGLYDLGKAYEEDIIGFADETKAQACYEKAAGFHDKYSAYEVGKYKLDQAETETEVKEAAQWLQEAVKYGSGEAATLLGTIYENGADGIVEIDMNKARECFEKGMELGDGESASELAFYYHKGLGVTQDKEKAKELYQKAIDLGDENSIMNLGFLYLDEKEEEKAFPYILKTAEMGLPEAQYLVGSMYLYGKGVEANREEALSWLQEASDAGDEDAWDLLNEIQ